MLPAQEKGCSKRSIFSVLPVFISLVCGAAYGMDKISGYNLPILWATP